MDSESEENLNASLKILTGDFDDDSTLELSESDLDNDLNATRTPTPRKSSSCSSPVPSPKSEEDIIGTIEDEIGKQLNLKAEKSNLSVVNVKNIIRQVLTNEHVRAMLEINGTKYDEGIPPFEIKLTRAKAKELLSSSPIQVQSVSTPWVPTPPHSETHVLIGEDLKEDDSGDEYVPGEEESEDDRDSSVASESDTSSLPPPTPPAPVCMEDHATQTASYTEDGVFKIPPPKTTEEEEAANIALRTRSKINLSDTPLEVIEKSFVPPDITTDMYDMDCGDDTEWSQFLKGFTEPLDEVTKPTEDEETDPEYNILADDKMNKIDNEDFRMDRAVKISKKEVKELWEELFEYLHNISEEYGDDKNSDKSQQVLNEVLESSLADLTHEAGSSENVEPVDQLSLEQADAVQTSSPKKSNENGKPDALFDAIMSQQQLCILEQQMRQHVQMLTQNFILTYEHPELHKYSVYTKEYLLNLKFLSEEKTFSSFRPVNLLPALSLIDTWVELWASNCERIRQTREHVQQELMKSLRHKMAGNWQYIVTFPKLMLETISKSAVFLYPFLLPKIPFKSENFSNGRCGFSYAEDCLLVFGMDQFKTFLENENTRKAKITMKETLSLVQEYVMPHRNLSSMLKHVMQSKHPRCATNPIQQYVLYDKLKPMVHYIYPFDQVLPPCKRMPDELPSQWKEFIYPCQNNISQNIIHIQSVQNGSPQQFILLNNSPQAASSLISFNNPVTVKTPRKQTPRTKTPKISLINKFNASQEGSNNSSIFTNIKSRSDSHSNTPQQGHVSLNRSLTSIELLLGIFQRPVALQKLVKFLTKIEGVEPIHTVAPEPVNKPVFVPIVKTSNFSGTNPNMPTLNTPIKQIKENVTETDVANSENVVTHTTIELSGTIESTNQVTKNAEEDKTLETNIIQDIKKEKVTKNLEFSTITSSSFQKANTSTEVEFCRNSSNIQICQTSHDENDVPSSSGYSSGPTRPSNVRKENQEDINPSVAASSTVKPEGRPNTRKELSGAEKKKNKLRKDFLANLSIATPESPESDKHKNEMFAMAYYDKLRENLELDDYHKIMQVLNDFGSGDVIDLYHDVQSILQPKYPELAEEFLFFFREKEASAVGQLIPWLELETRTKFLRKLEIYLKDQPAQLKKVYNTLLELTKAENLSMEKVKGVLVPMLKGNAMLLNLFLQNFRDERPPPSLLEGPYETMDLNKELARPDNEELHETFVVPNTEDKYGGQNCICHCHRIEDNEYKTRYKHCNACGLKYANGQLYLSAGRVFQPATVTFKTSPNVNHNARLQGKSTTITTTTSHKKKRSDTSPNKLPASSNSKENLEEDTEDEELGKRKRPSASQRTPRKRKKLDLAKQVETAPKPATSPKKLNAKGPDASDMQKDNIKPRKRANSGRKSKKDERKKTEIETDHAIANKFEDDDAEVIEDTDAEVLEDTDVEVICEVAPDDANEIEKTVIDEALRIEKSIKEEFDFEKTADEEVDKKESVDEEVDGEKTVDEEVEIDKTVDEEVDIEKTVDEEFDITTEIEESEHETSEEHQEKLTDDCMDSSGESLEKPLLSPEPLTAESESEVYLEESSQDNYESDDSTTSSTESAKGSQSDSNTNDVTQPWRRDEDTIILETLQREDDKEYAIQIISDKLPSRTVGQIRSRLSRLMDLLIETLKNT